ncbi:MAG TPA: folate-binding protein [Alphaproteobacteria bacterium]|nr:folate-binding protein [Alphaproteobacteria bacterium]
MAFISLPNRGLVTLRGPDAADFLQGLITNDIRKLAPGVMLYACLLTPQGKFLHDFFITQEGDTIVLDCEGSERAQDLGRKLGMYRLRKDVQIDVKDENPVYAGDDLPEGLPDPRHPDMGQRSFVKPNDIAEGAFEDWDEKRISLTIPDGSRDLVVGTSTLDEGRMDTLNAVDYQKGCYVGQELTARMHYRGLGKKHLETVRVDALPEGAELRSSCRGIGIALVRGALTAETDQPS